jgi:general L-amino acid transport system permease protein
MAFALSIYTATFTAEAVRSGIEAVSTGQKEAASALGLNKYQSLKLVVLNQSVSTKSLNLNVFPSFNKYL